MFRSIYEKQTLYEISLIFFLHGSSQIVESFMYSLLLRFFFLFKPNALPLLRILQWKAKFSAHHSNTGLCYTALCWLHMEPSLTGAGFEHSKKYGLFQIFLNSINSWKSKIICINQNLKHKEPYTYVYIYIYGFFFPEIKINCYHWDPRKQRLLACLDRHEGKI